MQLGVSMLSWPSGRGTRMAERKFTLVRDLPLVGGRDCLDLVNTTGARRSPQPRERLNSYGDLLLWSARVGLITARVRKGLTVEATRRPREASRALSKVLRIREELYRIFRGLIDEVGPGRASVRRLNVWWQAEVRRLEIVEGGHAILVQRHAAPRDLEPMVWPLIKSAIALLTSAEIERVKRCAECDWLFLDATKNGSRVWCKGVCGSRVRARRHYQRVRLSLASGNHMRGVRH